MVELTRDEIEYAFRVATNGFEKSQSRWQKRAERGLTDAELKAALEYELGIFGGCGGPDQLDISFKGSGLKIWASHGVHNHVTMKPTLEGAQTMKLAREIYGISDPDDEQMMLI